MSTYYTLIKRELFGYFRTPIAYVFLSIFIFASIAIPWYVGKFFENGDASLSTFFRFMPWIFLFLVPAVGMRLWAEEKRLGTWELLLTMPVSITQTVISKFLAAWIFLSFAILLTFTMPITIGVLGTPDWGPVISGYIGTILMAGSYLAICCITSAITKNQVISFVLSVLACLILALLGWSVFNDLMLGIHLPIWLVDTLANFSFITHFDPMVKGLIAVKDVFFFISIIFFCTGINILILEGNKRGHLSINIPLLFTALILINFISSVIHLRLDLTDKKLYTLSQGTQELVSKIKEPITLKFYYTKGVKDLPIFFKNYAERVEEILRQYQRISNGKIILKVINPQLDTPEEGQALRSGIQPQKLPNGEQLFFGLHAILAEQDHKIPLFSLQREAYLEFDISHLLHQVQLDKLPTLGILSSLNLFGGVVDGAPGQPPIISKAWHIISELQKNFNLKELNPSDTSFIPKDVDVLAVIHPRRFTPQTQYAIDQFILTGKPAFIALDPSSVKWKERSGIQQGPFGSWEDPSSDLPLLLKNWGLHYNAKEVVGDLRYATVVSASTNTRPSPFPVWLTIDEFPEDNLATAQLSQMLLPEVGRIQIEKKIEGLTVSPLIKSSNKSDEMMSSIIPTSTPAQLNMQILADSDQRILAAMLQGKFKTAFPEGIPAEEGEDRNIADILNIKENLISEAEKASTVIVIADTDFMANDFSVDTGNFMGMDSFTPKNDNLSFINNVFEYLAGSKELIALRSKGVAVRPFKLVRELEVKASEELQNKLFKLESELATIQNKLSKLLRENNGNNLSLPPEIQESVNEFQVQEARLRRERKKTRKSLRENIERLDRNLAFLNLLPIPFLIAILGTNYFYTRNKQQQTHRNKQ